ncbi:pyridoxamine 5'-phosphate oxidase family protein [Rhizobium hidalgonense]|uniref:Pyridoxamine 5'-phosphate oxidase family protein n=1 Tax=Rhizobium hidalgonense TaxID=1538159 RepID=A0AAJ2GU66_9HYPH|nr:pyridoxamine 5'-phosphate oxidase family protein [Rhizobium hidalgonense]MDR9774100.1 pyridoxamine 5'-phosphate oxidase family protein [Rhizobium hidalgonense]MDR9812143.1 pyridoxamine 5'-phosphate oxidase family protein [Rhizobium hidalgonense]MDR9820618.1 pyridoxamine 5'-phosphate oxidase family protein [Rhizobium hidalgonense]
MEMEHGGAPLTLADIDASTWRELEAAAANPQSGFRFLNLCSVDAEARPQARMVVLRRADRSLRLLEFHTDMRSPKWQELSANPHATILGFWPQTQLQFRLQGTVERHAAGGDQADAAWGKLSTWTRMTYAGGPPGDERGFDTIDEAALSRPVDEAEGKPHFGLLIFRVRTLDWFQLRRQGNRRALLTYDETGALAASRWVNP